VVPHEAMQAPQRTVQCWTVWRDCHHRCCWTKGIYLKNMYASHNHWSRYRWTHLCAWRTGCFIYRQRAPTTLSKTQNELYNRHNKHYYSLGSLISAHLRHTKFWHSRYEDYRLIHHASVEQKIKTDVADCHKDFSAQSSK